MRRAANFFANDPNAVNPIFLQRIRLLDALRLTSLTTLEARRLFDVMHPAARVMELRRMGYKIDTVWTTDFTSSGYPHRVARYVLRQDAEAT